MTSRTLLSSLSTMGMRRGNTPDTHQSGLATRRILRAMNAPLLVGLSYYVGTRIGFVWTPSGQPNSSFWPPNAILLAALLLTPRRSWWTLFLAVLPAHMFAQLQTGVPFLTALGWFLTNSSEALFGAYCVTRFTDPPKTLDSVRGVLIFVVFGVVFAPFATSFLDAAAVVVTGWGRGYWHLGLERFWTNALAELTIVPIIVLCSLTDMFWIRRVSVARWGEAALLAIGTVLVAILVFGPLPPSTMTAPALLYLPLPFLLWAAARFGLPGLSLSLLSLALISTWYTMHGLRPFPYASLPQNMLSLQILFCVVAVPLMILAAVMAESRRTQESLRGVSGRLIEAQEQERARIGRELHDDINQRLAMLAIELEELEAKAPDFVPGLRSNINELRNQTLEISTSVQTMSHELHSKKLEYLGLVGATRNFCIECSERQKMEIEFKSYDVPANLPLDRSLCLFRVLQESLHNAVKHSGTRHFDVELWGSSGEIHLTVSDLGVGFDTKGAMQGSGLGLTSMQERLRLVNGELSIDSQPQRGTRIHACVPLSSQSETLPAAG